VRRRKRRRPTKTRSSFVVGQQRWKLSLLRVRRASRLGSIQRLRSGDTHGARLRLRRWLKDGEIRVAPDGKGCGIDAFAVIAENIIPGAGLPAGNDISSSGGRSLPLAATIPHLVEFGVGRAA
jgi:hypothetical protein